MSSNEIHSSEIADALADIMQEAINFREARGEPVSAEELNAASIRARQMIDDWLAENLSND